MLEIRQGALIEGRSVFSIAPQCKFQTHGHPLNLPFAFARPSVSSADLLSCFSLLVPGPHTACKTRPTFTAAIPSYALTIAFNSCV